jgi:hypothetical protein
MSKPSNTHDDRVRALAIALQRQKTAMETTGLQERYWDAYWKLSEAIWSLEKVTGISAPALRDEEDKRLHGSGSQ